MTGEAGEPATYRVRPARSAGQAPEGSRLDKRPRPADPFRCYAAHSRPRAAAAGRRDAVAAGVTRRCSGRDTRRRCRRRYLFPGGRDGKRRGVTSTSTIATAATNAGRHARAVAATPPAAAGQHLQPPLKA